MEVKLTVMLLGRGRQKVASAGGHVSASTWSWQSLLSRVSRVRVGAALGGRWCGSMRCCSALGRQAGSRCCRVPTAWGWVLQGLQNEGELAGVGARHGGLRAEGFGKGEGGAAWRWGRRGRSMLPHRRPDHSPPHLQIGVSNLAVRGTLRISIKPLLDDFPFAGAVKVGRG
mgnify:CR=1 FL=1